MASVYQRKGSRFWWIKYRDPVSGELVRKSTGYDVTAHASRRKAKALEATWTQREMAAPRTRETERWEAWADGYLRDRYAGSLSLDSALLALRDLLVFFREHGIRTPRQVTYQVASSFVPWRLSTKLLGKVKLNTARLRFVYLSVLMSEAVRRGFSETNPCREVRLKKAEPKEKQEISPEDQARIEAELLSKPQWMREQWLVLMRHGCRIAETAVPLNEIDTDAMTITFRLKGGKKHAATLHQDLLPLIATARAENRKTLIEGPPVTSWSSVWSDFFSRRKLPYSIHCTRVTVITRLIRAGHSTSTVSNFIGHTEAVNRIYRKLKPRDSQALLDTLAGAPIQA